MASGRTCRSSNRAEVTAPQYHHNVGRLTSDVTHRRTLDARVPAASRHVAPRGRGTALAPTSRGDCDIGRNRFSHLQGGQPQYGCAIPAHRPVSERASRRLLRRLSRQGHRGVTQPGEHGDPATARGRGGIRRASGYLLALRAPAHGDQGRRLAQPHTYIGGRETYVKIDDEELRESNCDVLTRTRMSTSFHSPVQPAGTAMTSRRTSPVTP